MTPRALVVDDSLTVRMDIGEALESAGFDPVMCPDLGQARAGLAEGPCDLVVLDILLPDGDGVDFLRELKSDPSTAHVPVLMLSTEAEVRNRVRGIDAGADEYIGKPYDLGQVVARARALVERRDGRRSEERPHVLVVDDSATYRHLLAEALAEQGYAVQTAATGEEGLSLAVALRPAAVIIDGVLPGIDGMTVVRRLKSDAALRSTPCVLLTGAEGAGDELRSLEAGADAYVRKSEDLGVVLVRLAALLRGAQASGGEASASLLGPKRLLAVDDSETYLHELGAQLRDEGYDVVLARSGAEAVELLAAQSVDCILLDLVMPGLSGQETCRRIKDTPAWRDIPLVMLTAREDREAMIEGINAGADDYIAKSADFDVLKARLRAQLRRKHFEDENRWIREKLVRRETEARFQALIHSNIIGVIVTDLDGHITDANDAFLALLGYSRAMLEAGALRSAQISPPEWRARDEEAVRQLHLSGSVAPFEKELVRRDGRRLPIVLGLVLPQGTEMIVGFVLDRTEQKLADERIRDAMLALEGANRELARAKEEAEQASRFKSIFLANMSHELRTPLNAIIGFAELLHDGAVRPDMPEHQEFLGDILASGQHLLQLINDVLDLSKVEAGKLEFHPRSFTLRSIVAEVLATLRPLSAKKQIQISTDVDVDVEPIVLDPSRLKQVLYNYLSNALKFTPEQGAVFVRGRAVAECAFRLEVEDTGIGIASADVDSLFAEFRQLDAGAAKRHAGTGLGLALTKRLVEAQGGAVGVTSVLGRGSMFYAVLPRRAEGGPALPPPRTVEGTADAATVLVYVRRAERRDAAIHALAPARYHIVTACSGAQAIAHGEAGRADVIVVDGDEEDLRDRGLLPALLVGDAAHPAPGLVFIRFDDASQRCTAVGRGDEPLDLLEAVGAALSRRMGHRS